jgi:hypothetical protein
MLKKFSASRLSLATFRGTRRIGFARKNRQVCHDARRDTREGWKEGRRWDAKTWEPSGAPRAASLTATTGRCQLGEGGQNFSKRRGGQFTG